MFTDPSGLVTKCWPNDTSAKVCQSIAPSSKPFSANPNANRSDPYYQPDYLNFEPSGAFVPAVFASGAFPKNQFTKEDGSHWGTGNLCGVFAVGTVLQNLDRENLRSILGIEEFVEIYGREVQLLSSSNPADNTNAGSGSAWWHLHRLVEKSTSEYTTYPPVTLDDMRAFKTYSDKSYQEYFSILRSNLRANWKPIVRVGFSQNDDTGIYSLKALVAGDFGHFVAITGLSTTSTWQRGPDWQWVRIYNSLYNRTEYYKADEFDQFLGSARETMYICLEGSKTDEGECQKTGY